jgi:hypothetical protein
VPADGSPAQAGRAVPVNEEDRVRESAPTRKSPAFNADDPARRWAQPLVETLADGFVALYLYGSATTHEFDPTRSDVNLLLVARALPASTVRALAAAMTGPTIAESPVNLVTLTRAQVERSLDTFAMEIAHVKMHGRLLAGQDILASLTVPAESLRAQIERELLLVSVRLRRAYLHRSQDQNALSSEVHAAIGSLVGCARGLTALGLIGPTGSAESALSAMAELAGVEARPFHDAWRFRHDRAAVTDTLYRDLLDAVDAVLHRVDRHESGTR